MRFLDSYTLYTVATLGNLFLQN